MIKQASILRLINLPTGSPVLRHGSFLWHNAKWLCAGAGIMIIVLPLTVIGFAKTAKSVAMSELTSKGWVFSRTYDIDWRGHFVPRSDTSISSWGEPNVAVASIQGCLVQRDLKLLAKFRKIDSIRLRLKGECLSHCSFTTLGELPELSYFAVENMAVSSPRIREISTWPAIESVSFGYCDLRKSQLSQLASRPSLKTIEFFDCQVDDNDISKLMNLRSDLRIVNAELPSLPNSTIP